MTGFKVGQTFRGKQIKDFVKLSNGWYVLKTENGKSPQDFKVRLVYSLEPLRFLTPKHAHFAIDLYGKYCACREKARGFQGNNRCLAWKTCGKSAKRVS